MKSPTEAIIEALLDDGFGDSTAEWIAEAVLGKLSVEGWEVRARPLPRDTPFVKELLSQAAGWDREAEMAETAAGANRCRAVAAQRREEAERVRTGT